MTNNEIPLHHACIHAKQFRIGILNETSSSNPNKTFDNSSDLYSTTMATTSASHWLANTMTTNNSTPTIMASTRSFCSGAAATTGTVTSSIVTVYQSNGPMACLSIHAACIFACWFEKFNDYGLTSSVCVKVLPNQPRNQQQQATNVELLQLGTSWIGLGGFIISLLAGTATTANNNNSSNDNHQWWRRRKERSL